MPARFDARLEVWPSLALCKLRPFALRGGGSTRFRGRGIENPPQLLNNVRCRLDLEHSLKRVPAAVRLIHFPALVRKPGLLKLQEDCQSSLLILAHVNGAIFVVWTVQR